MPLEREELAREAGEKRVVGCRLGEEDGEEANLGRGARGDLRAEARGEQLCAEAGTEEGRARADGLGDEGLLGPKPRELMIRAG